MANVDVPYICIVRRLISQAQRGILLGRPFPAELSTHAHVQLMYMYHTHISPISLRD